MKKKMKAQRLFSIINFGALIVALSAQVPLFVTGHDTQGWAVVFAHLMFVVGFLAGTMVAYRQADEWDEERRNREDRLSKLGFRP